MRLAVAGLGKIARDQHLPAAAASPAFELVAGADPAGWPADLPAFGPVYASVEELLANGPTAEAMAMCQPPQARFAGALAAIRAGRHVLLEKPPGATLGEVERLRAAAEATGVTLFAAWHSRFAPGVEAARAWAAGRRVRRVDVNWKEDVRRWHPGQRWIWEPGGLGVFDPAVNALSIATRVLPPGLVVRAAEFVVPANRTAPVAAELEMELDGAPVRASLDFLQQGPQTWDVAVETDGGTLLLTRGGAGLAIDGRAQDAGPEREYPAIYDRFAQLIADGRSEVDAEPFRLVADAFLLARRREAPPFED